MCAKPKLIYKCSKCDSQFSKWSGRCLECGAWGTVTEDVDTGGSTKISEKIPASNTIDLLKLDTPEQDRLKTDISEVDRVLGGGLVPGSLILLSGEPGIGKSTILAQITDSIGKNNDVLYVSGEESALQVKGRLERLKCDLKNIGFLGETNVERIIATARKNKPKLLVVDSIQTVHSAEVPSDAGGVSQIRTSTVKFLELAKKHSITVVLVGHITKDGQVAGPKSLEHIVDTVIYLEVDSGHEYRLLRATKNRFGSVNEVGIFEMTSEGFVEIKDPSGVFLEEHSEKISGSATSSILEGTRPFLLEVQALVTKTVFGYPQRKASGFDPNRLQVLCAVMVKRANINLTNQDVILNIVGGVKVNDPGLDLAVTAAIASSLLNLPIAKGTMVVGEVGLGGEVRPISRMEERIKAAANLGFKRVICPQMSKLKTKDIELIPISSLKQLKDLL